MFALTDFLTIKHVLCVHKLRHAWDFISAKDLYGFKVQKKPGNQKRGKNAKPTELKSTL